MRCAEVQELLAQGHSLLYFNAPVVHRASPYADEVDRHAYYCPECGEHLIRLLRAQFRRRPGLLHLIRLNHFKRRIRESMHLAAAGGFVEESPIVRIANTIIQQAIKIGADRVELTIVPRTLAPNVRFTVPEPVMHDVSRAGSPGPGSFDGDIADIAESPNCAQIEILDRRQCVCSYRLPDYVRGPLWARFKSMADLLLTVQEEPQHGRIPIRYENRDYDIIVDTSPGELGETLHMTIVPARHPDRD